MTEMQKALRRTAVRTVEVAEILRDWRAQGARGDSNRTLAWLARESGIGKREIRRILVAGTERAGSAAVSPTGTTSERVFDALMTAIGRQDLYWLLERVEDGRSAANRRRARLPKPPQTKFSCAPAAVPSVA